MKSKTIASVELCGVFFKLSEAQSRVVIILLNDKDAYCLKSRFFNFQEIVAPNTVQDTRKKYFNRETMRVLITKWVVVNNNGRWVLNPKIKIHLHRK